MREAFEQGAINLIVLWTIDGLEDLKGLTKLKKLNLDGTLASGLGLKESIPDLEIIR